MPLSSPSSTASRTASGRERWNDWSADAPSTAATVSKPSRWSAASSAPTVASSCSTTRIRLPKTARGIASVEGGGHRVDGGEDPPRQHRHHHQMSRIDPVLLDLGEELMALELHPIRPKRHHQPHHAIL